jgi:hypothetical protein
VGCDKYFVSWVTINNTTMSSKRVNGGLQQYTNISVDQKEEKKGTIKLKIMAQTLNK